MSHAPPAPHPSPRVWFVTGAGRGLGRAFAEAALGAGHRVVAALRRPEALDDLAHAHPEALRTLPLDVRERPAVAAAVERAAQFFGRLDVVVNNAGYGLVGTVEEVSEAEAREQMNTNFFGALWVTQAALPILRGQGSGHIVQISSVGGVGTMPAFGLYNASKWALEAFSEALATEVAEFGIRVTIAELGGFATDWAWGSLRFAPGLSPYDPLRQRTFGTPRLPWDMSQQARDEGADPAEAARALLEHVTRDEAGPLRLLVGADAPGHVASALARRRDDYRKNDAFSWPALGRRLRPCHGREEPRALGGCARRAPDVWLRRLRSAGGVVPPRLEGRTRPASCPPSGYWGAEPPPGGQGQTNPVRPS